jgi:cytochrome P450
VSTEDTLTGKAATAGDTRKPNEYHFDRHTPEYRTQFTAISDDMHAKCPVAWTDTYDGHWVAAGHQQVFELARCPYVSNDHDVTGEGTGYRGINIPPLLTGTGIRGGMLEMDEPEHSAYRTVLNPYLSPAAVKRWAPFVDEIVRAAIDEKIEVGRIDFVDDLANVVPAVLTLAMMGIPLNKWKLYCEPIHANVYTPADSPQFPKVLEQTIAMGMDMLNHLLEIREHPRPGLVDAMARLQINGEPPPDMELLGMLTLIVGGGFDTTTALTAHALEWLGEHPEQRDLLRREAQTLLDPATEEFLRYFTPAPGDGRTIAADLEMAGTRFEEGDRLWLSWAMANRDPAVFPNPNRLELDRKNNRHFSFGLGVHRCIGSNVARTVFKSMLLAVLDRMSDYQCDAEGTVHYQTIGVIQGMQHLPATFTPGRRLGPGLDETLEKLQRVCDEQGVARPITEYKEAAVIA